MAVVGHSLIKGLKHFLQNNNFHLKGVLIQDFALPGGQVYNKEHLQQVRAFLHSRTHHSRFDVLVLDLGANDLDNANSPDPRLLAADVVDFANSLLNYARTVVVLPAYYRALPRVANYLHLLPSYNSTLRRICRELHSVVFWPHRNLTLNWEQYLVKDGVHLNREGRHRYFRSVRGAILRALKL